MAPVYKKPYLLGTPVISHEYIGSNEWEFDFISKSVTPLASRPGMVVEVNQAPAGHIRRFLAECTQYRHDEFHRTNYITIDHGDETYAQYFHVFTDLKVGQTVRQGDALGRLSPAPILTLPHLHFIVKKKGKPGFIPVEFSY